MLESHPSSYKLVERTGAQQCKTTTGLRLVGLEPTSWMIPLLCPIISVVAQASEHSFTTWEAYAISATAASPQLVRLS